MRSVWGWTFQYDGRGVLFIQEFLGIKHSEGKRKDWARHGFLQCVYPARFSNMNDTMLGSS
jgi:hypothetical protein